MVPFDDTRLRRGMRGFTHIRQSGSPFFLNTVTRSSKRGDAVVYRFTGKRVTLVGTKGPNQSKARIFINGKLVETIDARTVKFNPRKPLFSMKWNKSRTRQIKIVNLGTPGRTRFDVDGLAVDR
jgi:hypothetical protein